MNFPPKPSVVVHAKSGRELSYGAIAAFAEVPEKAPEINPEDLKKPAQFRLITKDVMRIELPRKVNGSAQYSIDVQLPGMLYGAVLRAPVEDAKPANFDEAQVAGIKGVVKAVVLPYGVGVIAETPWAAFAARRVVETSVSWTKDGKGWGFDSDKGLEVFASTARDPSPRQPTGSSLETCELKCRKPRPSSRRNIYATTLTTRRWSR